MYTSQGIPIITHILSTLHRFSFSFLSTILHILYKTNYTHVNISIHDSDMCIYIRVLHIQHVMDMKCDKLTLVTTFNEFP